MIDRFNGLGHHGVVGGNHKDYDVRNLGSARSHGREGFVTGRIEKRQLRSAFQLNVIGANVLRDTPGLTRNDILFPDVVQKRCLSVIDVAHYRYNR
jgi:hypothetical protein